MFICKRIIKPNCKLYRKRILMRLMTATHRESTEQNRCADLWLCRCVHFVGGKQIIFFFFVDMLDAVAISFLLCHIHKNTKIVGPRAVLIWCFFFVSNTLFQWVGGNFEQLTNANCKVKWMALLKMVVDWKANGKWIDSITQIVWILFTQNRLHMHFQ